MGGTSPAPAESPAAEAHTPKPGANDEDITQPLLVAERCDETPAAAAATPPVPHSSGTFSLLGWKINFIPVVTSQQPPLNPLCTHTHINDTAKGLDAPKPPPRHLSSPLPCSSLHRFYVCACVRTHVRVRVGSDEVRTHFVFTLNVDVLMST
jgi:hypothetical protein